MTVTSAARPARPRRWAAGLAWTLWVLGMVGLAAVPWLDRLLRQAGRPELVQLTLDTFWPVLGMVSGATVGAVLVRPGALPAARSVALYYPATGFTALALIGFVLLLTPTGSLPSPRWRWWARGTVAAPVGLLLVGTLAGGPLDPRYQALGGPFDLRGRGGPLLVANQLALAVTTLAVVVAAGSLVGRFRRARGTERLQLRWVALAAVLVVLAGVVVLAALAIGVPGATTLQCGAAGFCIAVLPVATGAAILRYRLYDLDRIISRTLAYGLLTVLLESAYAGVVLGLGRLLPQSSNLVVAGATLAVAGVFQ